MSYRKKIKNIEDVYSTRPISTDMSYSSPSNEHEDTMQIQTFGKHEEEYDDTLESNSNFKAWNDNYNEQYLDNTSDTIKELKDENEILKDEIQETKNDLDQSKLLYKELENNYKNLIKENNKYQSEIKLYEQNINNLRKEHNEHQMIIKKFNDTKETEGQQLQKLQSNIDSQEQIIAQLQQSLEFKDCEIRNLKNEKKELNKKVENLNMKNENLENQLKDLFQKAQCDIITATNCSLRDDYQNHNIKLNKDILALQNILDKYVTNLKSNKDININGVKELLLKYGCQTVISDKEPNKSLIIAVLQRHVLEEIIKQADFYFTCSSKEHHLESNIISQTKLLTNLMKKLHNERLGDNELTNLMSIRLRQHVYIALSIQGFNNIKKSDDENSKHNFVDMISKKINEIINKYRVIKDIEENNYVNAIAEDLVRNVIRIFYFHLFIQEPIAQYRWIKNNKKVNKSYMKGSWDGNDVEDMVVEICSFPLIFKTSDSDDFKVFTPAKVYVKKIQ